MRIFRHIGSVAASVLPFALLSSRVVAEEAEAGGGGLPQFDPSQFPEQIFWLVVSFASLYVLMSLIALPRVARTQTRRKDIIAAEVEAARNANETAQAAIAAVDKSLSEARAKAQEKLSAMIAEVTEESAARQAAQDKELSRSLHRAEADIAVAREAALKDIRKDASGLSAEIVAKVLGSKGRVSA